MSLRRVTKKKCYPKLDGVLEAKGRLSMLRE